MISDKRVATSSMNLNQPASAFPSLQEQKDYWDIRWGRMRSPNDLDLRRAEQIVGFVGQIGLRQGKILDLGCGTGWFAGQLSNFGLVTAIDLSEGAISIAKARFPHIQFIAGNLFELTLPREEFDLVVCQEVIAHVADQAGLLNRIADVLKPRGYLVITTVNKFVIDRVDLGPDPREHIKQWLRMKDFKQLLAQSFQVLRTTTVIPMGDRGMLKFLNKSKFAGLLHHLLGSKTFTTLKERAGLGYTMMALAQKHNRP